jgi:tyrocidine synthetase-3
VEGLPRNASGKVVKLELRERFAEQPPAAEPVLPRSDLEAAVAATWQDVLGLPDIGVHDDFFDLGGHSLAATQIVARLQDSFDVELPPTAVFECPTVAELAATVSEAVTAVRSR